MDCSFDIGPYSGLKNAIESDGWDALDRDISNYDSDGDNVLDDTNDWTYAVGHQFRINPHESATYENRTFFGKGNPEVYRIPNNMYSNISGSGGQFIGETDTYKLTLQFNTAMKPDTDPEIKMYSTSGVHPVVPNGGTWQTNVFSNDTYITPNISLTSMMAGNIHVNVGGAKNTSNITMVPVIRAYNIILDADPPQNPIIQVEYYQCNTSLISWNNYSPQIDLESFEIYVESVSFNSISELTPVAVIDKNARNYKIESLEIDSPYYVSVVSVDTVGNKFFETTPVELNNTGAICFDKHIYGKNNTVSLTLNDKYMNMDDLTVESIIAEITSLSDVEGITVLLRETGANTGIFTSQAAGNDINYTTSNSDSINHILHISDGDSILAQTFNSISEVTRKDYATIDLSPPVTTLSTNIEFYGENVASLNFIYTLSATDSISGIDQIKYSLNNGSSILYTTPFTIDVEGNYTLTYWSEDKAGNYESANSIFIVIDSSTPSTPLDLSGTQVDLNIQLTWEANTELDIAGYNLYRNGSKINGDLLETIGYSDSINSGRQYRYNVTAIDYVGNESTFSEPFNITTLTAAPEMTSPLTGTAFVDNEITVRGSAESGSFVEIFVNGVSQGETIANSAGYFSLVGVELSEGLNTITSISTNAYGVKSAVSHAVTIPLDSKPQPPEGLTPVPGDTIITINWEANTETDIQGYNVYRDNEKLNHALITETTFTDTRLINSTQYQYRLSAVDENNSESRRSPGITATPVAGEEWETP
ncbi:MAG: hypothetical protein OMM_04679 [Candidatus Magnetoglobus multicellularis str. Araruama]|uniref:Fibronectin type-III domain-containing protein n=1 Tax=Candidatus Magnetoglobus multicellularis str. Araruama TaxID=890399 RepID=A0A1V1P090_9BACT|nr:MAG: hypothetical protein OMM_04679 [Candidatus Magnetoglobus multicellularis str. Araruama]